MLTPAPARALERNDRRLAFAPGGGLTVFEENGPAAVARHLHPVWKVVLPERGTAVAGRVRGAGLLVPPQLAHTAAVTSAYTALFVDPWLLGAPREVTALDGHAVRRLRDALARGAALPELVALAGPGPALDPRVAHALALATATPPAAAPGPRVHTTTIAPGLPVHAMAAIPPGLPVHAIAADLGLPVHAMAADSPELPIHAIAADLGLPVHAMAVDSPELPVHAIAAEVGLSVPRLRALVRASVGIPLVRLRQWARLRAAVAQLACSSVASAAATAGFADQAHLARTARAMLGRTPVSLSTHPVPGRPASPSPGLPDPTPSSSPAVSDLAPSPSPREAPGGGCPLALRTPRGAG